MRTSFRGIVASLAFAAACAAPAGAQSFTESHAKVTLVSEDSSFTPGHTVWLGVAFDLEKGWHTYWVNPGDSGEAPKIQWQLPQGFRVGEIHWPTPARLGTGTVIDYGYEGKVLLAVPVQVPADYQPKPVTISANVSYLVCSDVCIPAKAHPMLSVPAGAAANASASRALFSNARAAWPMAMPATWKAQAADQGDHFVLSIETGSRETQAAFFPLNEDQIDNATRQTTAANDHGAAITLKKSDMLTGPISTLKGVVVLGSGRAVEVAAPVTHGK